MAIESSKQHQVPWATNSKLQTQGDSSRIQTSPKPGIHPADLENKPDRNAGEGSHPNVPVSGVPPFLTSCSTNLEVLRLRGFESEKDRLLVLRGEVTLVAIKPLGHTDLQLLTGHRRRFGSHVVKTLPTGVRKEM